MGPDAVAEQPVVNDIAARTRRLGNRNIFRMWKKLIVIGTLALEMQVSGKRSIIR